MKPRKTNDCGRCGMRVRKPRKFCDACREIRKRESRYAHYYKKRGRRRSLKS